MTSIKETLRGLAIAALGLMLIAACMALSGCSNEQGAASHSDEQTPSSGALVNIDGMDFSYSKRDNNPSYDVSSATKINMSS